MSNDNTRNKNQQSGNNTPTGNEEKPPSQAQKQTETVSVSYIPEIPLIQLKIDTESTESDKQRKDK